MKIPLVDLKAQYETIQKEVDKEIIAVVRSSSFILGDKTKEFERNFAKLCDSKYAVGLDSGISALELGMRALGIGDGDEVLTPANSFIASSSAISFTGAKPVLVDCSKEDFSIDLDQAEKQITKRTKALMVVHLYGQPVDLNRAQQIAKKHNLYLIEDACQAHGARYGGKAVGSFGEFAAFSFYPGKNLGAYGDGGMLVTNNKKLADSVSMMRNYGQKEKYYHETLAWNRRLDNLQAAVLDVKLKRLNKWNSQRRKIALKYNQLLDDLPLELPLTLPNREHVFHLYVLICPKGIRNKLQNFLQDKGIDTGIHYPIPIHMQKAYRDLNHQKGQYPISEDLAARILSLPIYPEMSVEQIDYISRQLHSFFKN